MPTHRLAQILKDSQSFKIMPSLNFSSKKFFLKGNRTLIN